MTDIKPHDQTHTIKSFIPSGKGLSMRTSLPFAAGWPNGSIEHASTTFQERGYPRRRR
ncbi:hypothetical protein [Guyparkeria sp.]|uniref:hypothetical protein n=1 Tax=Guyparkeria sp. TaxID=2035736 RepID=UPI00397060A3